MEGSRTLVAGGGGFIGGHLVRHLLEQGVEDIVVADVKPVEEWYQVHDFADSRVLDLRAIEACREATEGCNVVYNLAADMGGMGFIENNKALCMLSSLINTHLLLAARDAGVERYFFASSACVYNTDKQQDSEIPGLKEGDAYPALPEDGYGWEKLLLRGCAATSWKISAWSLASLVITMSTARTEPGKAVARRLRLRSVAR